VVRLTASSRFRIGPEGLEEGNFARDPQGSVLLAGSASAESQLIDQAWTEMEPQGFKEHFSSLPWLNKN
jgi:hypothetical protein